MNDHQPSPVAAGRHGLTRSLLLAFAFALVFAAGVSVDRVFWQEGGQANASSSLTDHDGFKTLQEAWDLVHDQYVDIASIDDPAARRRYQTYEKIPVASLASLLEFQKVVRQELKHIRQPLVVIHSLHDETVPYGNLDYIKAIVASEDVKTVTLKKSNHIITVDYDKATVAKSLARFFKKFRKA